MFCRRIRLRADMHSRSPWPEKPYMGAPPSHNQSHGTTGLKLLEKSNAHKTSPKRTTGAGLGHLPFTCFADNWINELFKFHRGTCFFELCLDLVGFLFVDLFFDSGWSIFNQLLGIHQ